MTEQTFQQATGDWIRQQRAALDIKQEDLAQALGVSPRTVSNWESGKHRLSSFNERRMRSIFSQKRASAQKAVTA
jgi:DNA-binding transcriptional regulator YiaG